MLLRRHGVEDGGRRIVDGTRRNCEALDVPDRFDEALTRRWIDVVAGALADDAAGDVEAFLRANPELARSDLLGAPAWRRGPAGA